MKKSLLIVLLLAIVAGGAFWYWQHTGKTGKIAYLTETAARGAITRQVVATGTIGAVDLVSVGAQVSGQIKKLHVKLGQQVKQGDPVAEIDSVSQLNQYNTDRAILASRKADLVAKEANLRIAQTRFEREKALYKKSATSKEAYEDAENTLALARAELTQVQSQIKQTELALDTDRLNLSYTHITAPLNGTVVAVVVEEGQTVNANQTTPTLVQIADLTRMENNIEISEGDIGVIREGMPLEFTVLSLNDKVFSARITSLDPGLTTLSDGQYDKSSSSSGLSSSSSEAVYFYGKAVLDNPEGLLRIGMTTENTITVNEVQNVITVPLIAVQTRRRHSYVQILTVLDTPEEREVQTGLSDGVRVEIRSGIQEGEKVILGQLTAEELKASGNDPRGARRSQRAMMGGSRR
ncbi:MAG: efflux RND transporter periplasmic adaptor subunit [Deltaproteobacteria bacterium]|nr:efflux RND transporter periplasmic adaptor subunit [Deltaproteobacteria bacterium]